MLLAAPAALFLSQGEAKAVLTYNIFESAGNVVVQASGSLNLVNPQGPQLYCGSDGAIVSGLAVICTGADPSTPFNSAQNFYYTIDGPTVFDGTVSVFTADSVSGIFTLLWGSAGIFSIDNSYTSGNTIASSATFLGTSLSSLGFTQSSGLIGTWTLVDSGGTIRVYLGSTPTPGPLPLLGAGAAFGWSRRLRRRIASPSLPSTRA
jgi:hypothetical protein